VTLPFVTEATRGATEENALDHRRFEIWAADHIGFDYEFEAFGPVEAVTRPGQGPGAEPAGNDDISYLGGDRYRVSGHTGDGYDDTWQVDWVYRVVITDAEIL
jgi:hypothetical protein